MEDQSLLEKAKKLPLEPGVYLMLDKAGQVIYVGKAKKLRNRVSSYFMDSAAHTPKTRMLVSKIRDFDVILAASEFEALILECSLIKRHMPRYNILLKDDKGYPYIRVDLSEPYPTFSIVGRQAEDGAAYFGPYGGRQVTQQAIRTVRQVMKLPDCSRKFPRDVGRERPCINLQLGNCEGWCLPEHTQAEHLQAVRRATMILDGKYKQVADQIQSEMEAAAEDLQFERAAALRDRLRAVQHLGQKQLVTAGARADTDVVGCYQGEVRNCFTVLHFIGGNLVDKDFQVLDPDPDADLSETVSALVKQYYLRRGAVPRRVLLPAPMEDSELFAQLLKQDLGKTVRFLVPARGADRQLVALANKNALEEAQRVITKTERTNKTLELLRDMLGLETIPNRMEAYDISNTAGTNIVGSMVTFQNGQPLKRAYKRFAIRDMPDQDDYASMVQMLTRRLQRYLDGDESFSPLPDLLLIDGGAVHAAMAEEVTRSMNISVPVFGMVKDDRHRTRALVRPDGREIGISGTQAVFALIGTIQEEVHRFAIEYHRKLRSRSMKRSTLESIPGIGEKRRAELMKHFGSLAAIRQAGYDELAAVLPKNAAQAVYDHFHPQTPTAEDRDTAVPAGVRAAEEDT